MEFEAGKILELRRGDWRLDLAPQAGGRVFGLRAKSGGRERDLIVPVPSDLPLAKALANAGCYPLVPFSNRIENARFCAAGRLVQLSAPALGAPHAIHGYGWTAAWAVEAQDESEAELCYRHPAGEWPWAFSAHLRFCLDEEGLLAELLLSNESEEPMPCGLGFHPYFPRPLATRITTETKSHWISRSDRIPTGSEVSQGVLDFASGAELPIGLDDGFSGWSRKAVLDYGDWQIKLSASEGLDHLVIYTPEKYPFCCVEPVSHVTNAANRAAEAAAAAGWRYLAPGGQWRVWMRIGVSA